MTTPSRPHHSSLLPALVATGSVVAAAEHLMDVIVGAGLELPSLYLERGGRLRCLAQRGYWQIFDGMTPGAGVLGRTVLEGRTRVVEQPAQVPEYIDAAPGTVAEVCVPLRLEGRVIGALNVESRRPIGDGVVPWIESLGTAMADAIAALGGPPAEEPAELLARIGSELAAMSRHRDIAAHALEAARTVSGLSGAALFPSDDLPGV